MCRHLGVCGFSKHPNHECISFCSQKSDAPTNLLKKYLIVNEDEFACDARTHTHTNTHNCQIIVRLATQTVNANLHKK